jgi:ABC-type transport system involved in multi-copper enzyme maturation permease subunit
MAGRFTLAMVTFKGGVRDRLLLGVIAVSFILVFAMPLFSSFSMRDVFGVAATFSLSAISATGVLLAIIIGGTLISRDIQSRSIYSVATLPLSRGSYILGKYLGLAFLLFCSIGILGLLNYCGLWFMAGQYPPDKPILWSNYVACLLFDLEKLLILAAVLVFFSSIATSSFLPMFLTLAVYAVGMTTEKVKYFIETVKGGQDISPVVKVVTKGAYYIFPNLSPFDLKRQMIYALPIDYAALALTFCYGIGYIIIMLVLACTVFARKDLV